VFIIVKKTGMSRAGSGTIKRMDTPTPNRNILISCGVLALAVTLIACLAITIAAVVLILE